MKNLRDILIVVAVGTALFFPTDADAGPFKKRKAKRAAKRATVQYTSPDCTITGCPIHTPGTNTGSLGTNSKGGFTGQLTDDYFANYFAGKTAAPPQQGGAATVTATATENAEVLPVDEAKAALAAAEQDLLEKQAVGKQDIQNKQEALEIAEDQQYNQDVLELITLRAEVSTLDAKHEQVLNKLLVQVEELEDKLGFPPPPPPEPPTLP